MVYLLSTMSVADATLPATLTARVYADQPAGTPPTVRLAACFVPLADALTAAQVTLVTQKLHAGLVTVDQNAASGADHAFLPGAGLIS